MKKIEICGFALNLDHAAFEALSSMSDTQISTQAEQCMMLQERIDASRAEDAGTDVANDMQEYDCVLAELSARCAKVATEAERANIDLRQTLYDVCEAEIYDGLWYDSIEYLFCIIEEKINDIAVIYCDRAWKYIGGPDRYFRAVNLAAECGFEKSEQLRDLEFLATLLAQDDARQRWCEVRDDIADLYEKHEAARELYNIAKELYPTTATRTNSPNKRN